MSLIFSPTFSPTLNPVYSPTLSPVSKIVVSPYSTQVVTTNLLSPYVVPAFIEIDPGLNDSYMAQKEMTEYMLYRILDKWLYTDEMCHILKYLKVSGNTVTQITNESEIKANKICNDSVEDVEKKGDYIQENILTEKEMRKLLQRMIQELGLKWYDLPKRESFVVDAVERFLNKRLKERVGK